MTSAWPFSCHRSGSSATSARRAPHRRSPRRTATGSSSRRATLHRTELKLVADPMRARRPPKPESVATLGNRVRTQNGLRVRAGELVEGQTALALLLFAPNLGRAGE
jgi:hypothetical protein